jgi:transposase-like protein
MKKSKFTEQQIVFALKQAELGRPVEEVCRKIGISDATFYNWKKKYGGLGPSELRRLRQSANWLTHALHPAAVRFAARALIQPFPDLRVHVNCG